MKRPHLLFYVLFCTILLISTTTFSQEPVVVSGNPNAPPIVWEERQELVGLGPDLATGILKELGIGYSLRRFGNWKNVQIKTKNGDVDMLVSAYRNKEREQYLAFSIPYLSQPTVIVVEKGKEFDFSNWDTLKGKKGVTNVGESYGQEFDEFIQQHLDVSYYQFERAIELLNLGEVDYLVVDLYTALIYARLLQGEDAITILEPPVTIQNFHLAVRKDSPLVARLPEINEKLKARIERGEISKTFLAYFDKWKQLVDRRAQYFSKNKSARSDEQKAYLKEQEEMARQRVLKTMVDRDELPESAQ